jgi:uncharacterized protein (TIGR02646 family)
VRFVGNVTPISAKWKKWQAVAVTKRAAIVAAWRIKKPFTIDKHYRDKAVKDELWSIFGGKCSYCEIRLEGAQFGDVEHYRPKSGVRDTDDHEVLDPGGNPHPGYFWLAYDWANLLIACAECNQVKISKNLVKHGKGERFPLEAGQRSFTPTDGVVEQPTLLNPRIDDPTEHLIFDASGTISWRTERGRRTINLLGLNDRDGLLEARKETCSDLRGMYVRRMAAAVDGNIALFDELTKQIDTHRDGKKPFSATTAVLIREIDELLKAAVNRSRVA